MAMRRLELGTKIAPYERAAGHQPELYGKMYQDNVGGDRTISAACVYKNTTAQALFSYDNFQIDTTSWPAAYDGKTHKAMFNLVQFAMYGSVVAAPGSATDNTGQVFAGGTQQFAYSLSVRAPGAANAPTVLNAQSSLPESWGSTSIASFPAQNSSYTLAPTNTTAANTITYTPVNFTFPVGTASFMSIYPVPDLLKFQLDNIVKSPSEVLQGNTNVYVYMKFLITLLD